MIPRILMIAVSAFFLSSSAWASTSNCSKQSDSTDGCSTTTQQFVNIFTTPAALGFQNTNVFAYQQTANSPCIYDNSSCNNGGFPTVLLSGDANKNNVFSQQYTVQALLDILKVPDFFVGIDVNSTGTHGTETLVRFDMLVNNVLAFSLPAGSYPMLVGNNPGNGYSDNLITGLSFRGIDSTAIIQFVMSENFDVGGREQFFLIADAPEPATFWLMGGALALLGLFAWCRNKALA
jgi:hypothetical protein